MLSALLFDHALAAARADTDCNVYCVITATDRHIAALDGELRNAHDCWGRKNRHNHGC